MQLSRTTLCLIVLVCPIGVITDGVIIKYVRKRETVCGWPLSCAHAQNLGLVPYDKPVWIFHKENNEKMLASCRINDGGGWTVIQVREASIVLAFYPSRIYPNLVSKVETRFHCSFSFYPKSGDFLSNCINNCEFMNRRSRQENNVLYIIIYLDRTVKVA